MIEVHIFGASQFDGPKSRTVHLKAPTNRDPVDIYNIMVIVHGGLPISSAFRAVSALLRRRLLTRWGMIHGGVEFFFSYEP